MPEIRKNNCPCCGYESDQASNMEDETLTPRVNDLSICINCGGYLQYGEGLKLQLITPEILSGIPDETLQEMNRMKLSILATRPTRH